MLERKDMKRIPIREWVERFKRGEFESQDLAVQVEAGWHDWFCMDSSLPKRLRFLGSIVERLQDGGKVDLDNSYVFFRNCLPLAGIPYDCIKVCDIETYKVQFVLTIGAPYENNGMRYHLYSSRNGFETMIFSSVKKTGIIAWLNKPW